MKSNPSVWSDRKEGSVKVTIELDEKDARFAAEVLHKPHLDMTPNQHKNALRIGNEIAKQLMNVNCSNEKAS